MKPYDVSLHLTILMLALTTAPAAAQLRAPVGDRPGVEITVGLSDGSLQYLYASSRRSLGAMAGLAFPTDSVTSFDLTMYTGQDLWWVGGGLQVRLSRRPAALLRPFISLAAGYAAHHDAPERTTNFAGPIFYTVKECPDLGNCGFQPTGKSVPAQGFAFLARLRARLAASEAADIVTDAGLIAAPGPASWLLFAGVGIAVRSP